MRSFGGYEIVIVLTEPFELGRANAEIRGIVTGAVRCSTGSLLLVEADHGVFGLSPRHSGTEIEELSFGRVAVNVARLRGSVRDGQTIENSDIENIGAGMARLIGIPT